MGRPPAEALRTAELAELGGSEHDSGRWSFMATRNVCRWRLARNLCLVPWGSAIVGFAQPSLTRPRIPAGRRPPRHCAAQPGRPHVTP